MKGLGSCTAAVALLMASVAGAGDVWDPGCGVVPVVQQGGTVLYPLPRPFLKRGSDSVRTASREWTRGADYALDRTRGILRLLREPVPGETLWVRACWLTNPPPLELQLNTYRPARGAPDTAGGDSALRAAPAPRPVTSRSPSEAAAGTALVLSGNKTIAVDFGSSQDAFLRQSLDLGVSGTLAPGVELTGVLSDRNTPLTSAGATQDLQAVDRLLIELRAPQGGAALGDVALSLQRGEFARLERRLQGVRGEWRAGEVQGTVAAASAQGEFHRLEFFGIEGRQGPYTLTDRNGNLGVSVVAGSEVVTLDGERLARGESADYGMDYETARLTFSNRRPIGSSSRITVDYQFTLNRFRRNLAAASAGWQRGGWYGFTTMLTESDDRGRPLALPLDASDRLVLAASGDSSQWALGAGVVGGGGDYDLSPDSTAYVFAGPDSGAFTVHFSPVGSGRGDYVDSSVVAGRVTYRYVGAGNGSYRVGRFLPLPDSHQLWAVAGGVRRGALALEVEGALSRFDRNTFSGLDDGDNLGRAGHATLALEGAPPWLGGRAGLRAQARGVGGSFEPFSRLERSFGQEDWGLPIGADIEHQQRTEVSAFLKSRSSGELSASLGRLETPGGFRSLRRVGEWRRSGTVSTLGRWERSDGEQDGRAFGDGGRERRIGELGVNLRWCEPRLRAEWDERRVPSDTARAAERSRELGAELRSPRALLWQGSLGYGVRRETRRAGSGFTGVSEARTTRMNLHTPPAGAVGAALSYQLRDVEGPAVGRTRSDLASARLRAADVRHGLSGTANLEVTAEGENERTRALTFVGTGLGAYDSLGNLVGRGDYDLVLRVGPGLRRISRAATSARASWHFGASDSWRGSRIEFSFETEAGRRGALRGLDAALSPSAALADPALSRGIVTQRLEAEIAPGSRAGALRLRVERRVRADRSFDNFAQTLDDRSATSRWRTRPMPAWNAEIEARWKRQEAGQAVATGSAFRRVLQESGAIARLDFSPDARRRISASADAAWARPEPISGGAAPEFTRTLRLGPDLGWSLGAHGRLELGARRAFVWGPPAVGLLPSVDPAGAPRWEGSGRFDYRLRESATLGVSVAVVDRLGQPTRHTGRAEVRAFF